MDVRCKCQRAQAGLCPVVQCLAHAETEHVFTRLATDFCRIWAIAVGSDASYVAVSVKQLHRDGAPGIEGMRLRCFPNSRSADDFTHVLRDLQKELKAKLKVLALVPQEISATQQTVLRFYDACLRIVHILRLSPTLQLFSALYAAFVHTVRHLWREPVAATYLQ